MTRLTRLLLRAYPPSFRERYGAELATLVDDLPAGRSGPLDLARGAARAWMRPCFTGAQVRRGRLRATAATTWVAWCAGFLVAPAVNKALLDPPVAGAHGSVRALVRAGDVLFVLGWVLALLGATPLMVRVVLPALRERQWRALRPLLPAFILGALLVIGALRLSGSRSATPPHLSTTTIALATGFVVMTLAFVAALGLGPAVTLHRVTAPDSSLRLAALVSAPLAFVLAALSACSLAAVLQAGRPQLFGGAAPVAAALAIAGLASVTALISSARGARVARQR